jgi:tetratricopeptide (TPR) repeat protein
MKQLHRSLQYLFRASLGIFALAFVAGTLYSFERSSVPPSLSNNPIQLFRGLVEEGDVASAVLELAAYEAIVPVANRSILTQAGLLSDLGRRDEALAAYRRAAVSLPRDPTVHSQLGGQLFQRRLFDDASKAFETVVRLTPQDPFAHENVAVSYLNAGRSQQAIDAYLEIVDAGFANPTTYDMLSHAYENAGDHERALEHIEIAIDFDPSNPEIRAHYRNLTGRDAEPGEFR